MKYMMAKDVFIIFSCFLFVENLEYIFIEFV